MVPTFDKFLYPVLKTLGDGHEHTLKDLMKNLIDEFSLNEADINETVKSGLETKLHNRLQWATTYLNKARLVTRPKRGVNKITKLGKELLNKNIIEITPRYLSEHYSDFEDFANGYKQKTDLDTNKAVLNQDKTPSEVMDEAFDEIKSSLASDLLNHVKEQTPQFFERMVVKLLIAMGYGGSLESSGTVTQLSHDEGIDGIIKEDKLGLDAIYIQAKKYDKGLVGRPEIQKFVGALSGQGATKGIFITTSAFTKEAKDFKSKAVGLKMVLVDGEQLCNLMIDYNIGVSQKQTYEIKRIDTDFFDEE